MATTYDLTTDVGKVRLALGDTGAGDAWVFTDEEITYFLEQGSVTAAHIAALQALLTAKSYRVKYANVQGVVYDDRQQIEGIKAALAMLGGDMPTVSVTKSGSQPWELRHFAEGGS